MTISKLLNNYYMDCARLIGILIKYLLKTEMSSSANGGPLTKLHIEPADYKGGELPQLVIKEFSSHRRHSPF